MRGPETFRIGVISDTHGLLRPEALARLYGVQHIVHVGDIGAPGLIEALGEIAPVTAIRGNVDRAAWAAEYPETTTLDLAGLRVHLIHDRAELTPDIREGGADLVVFGHSHRASIEWQNGTLFLNPGSAGPRRFRFPVTIAIVNVVDGEPRPQIVPLMG